MSGCVEKNGQENWAKVAENHDITWSSQDIPDFHFPQKKKQPSTEMIWDDIYTEEQTAGWGVRGLQ